MRGNLFNASRINIQSQNYLDGTVSSDMFSSDLVKEISFHLERAKVDRSEFEELGKPENAVELLRSYRSKIKFSLFSSFKYSLKKLGNERLECYFKFARILDQFFFIPDPGSRGPKSTGSRIRIRNTACSSPTVCALEIYQLFSWPGLTGRIYIRRNDLVRIHKTAFMD